MTRGFARRRKGGWCLAAHYGAHKCRVGPYCILRLAAEPLRLQLPEWRSGSIIWIVDAVGEHKVVEAMLTRLLETEWNGHEVRLRARTKDGSYKMGVLGRGPQTARSGN